MELAFALENGPTSRVSRDSRDFSYLFYFLVNPDKSRRERVNRVTSMTPKDRRPGGATARARGMRYCGLRSDDREPERRPNVKGE